MMTVPRRILPAIVASQFAATSVWFAGNAVLPDLIAQHGLPDGSLGAITIAVQAGFIAGTLVFAVLGIADRFSPAKVFLAASLLAALFNAAACLAGDALWPLLGLRFAVGFCLAGVYPVGMRIAAGWYDRDLGKALGYLVGALVLGTALPHLVRGLGTSMPWQGVMLTVSAIAALGGVLMILAVPDGPHLKSGSSFDPTALAAVFRSPEFRASSFGYFGHMWELYAFWALLPVYVTAYASARLMPIEPSAISLLAFWVIGAGAIGCGLGGIVSLRLGSAPVAGAQLAMSGLCCLLSPLALLLPLPAFFIYLTIWGIAVVGDSPQFSALNSRYAPRDRVGSALTIVNCIGFAITIVAIQCLSGALAALPVQFVFLLLLPGPIVGLLALRPLLRAP